MCVAMIDCWLAISVVVYRLMIAGGGGFNCGFFGGSLYLADNMAGDNDLRSFSIFDTMSSMALLLARRVCLSVEFWLMMAEVLWRSAQSFRSRREIFSTRTAVESSRILLCSLEGVGVAFSFIVLCRGGGIDGRKVV